jgi:hypothetical protein
MFILAMGRRGERLLRVRFKKIWTYKLKKVFGTTFKHVDFEN